MSLRRRLERPYQPIRNANRISKNTRIVRLTAAEKRRPEGGFQSPVVVIPYAISMSLQANIKISIAPVRAVTVFDSLLGLAGGAVVLAPPADVVCRPIASPNKMREGRYDPDQCHSRENCTRQLVEYPAVTEPETVSRLLNVPGANQSFGIRRPFHRYFR